MQNFLANSTLAMPLRPCSWRLSAPGTPAQACDDKPDAGQSSDQSWFAVVRGREFKQHSYSKTLFSFNQELDIFDAVIAVQRKRKINVCHSALPRSRATNAEPEADIFEQSVISIRNEIATPGTAGIEKHGTSDAEQTKRIPVSEETLFEGQKRTLVTGLVWTSMSTTPSSLRTGLIVAS